MGRDHIQMKETRTLLWGSSPARLSRWGRGVRTAGPKALSLKGRGGVGAGASFWERRQVHSRGICPPVFERQDQTIRERLVGTVGPLPLGRCHRGAEVGAFVMRDSWIDLLRL